VRGGVSKRETSTARTGEAQQQCVTWALTNNGAMLLVPVCLEKKMDVCVCVCVLVGWVSAWKVVAGESRHSSSVTWDRGGTAAVSRGPSNMIAAVLLVPVLRHELHPADTCHDDQCFSKWVGA
jgi:hypothetical protein